MDSQRRVAIVGGGIIGASIAFQLVRRGITPILFEKNQLGSGTTSRSVGGVRPLFTHDLTIQMMQRNVRFYERFEDEVGHPVRYNQDGYLFLYSTDEIADSWNRRKQTYDDYGIETRVLSPEETNELAPFTDASQYDGAIFSPTSGFVDPYQVTMAFTAAAEDRGAVVKTNCELHSIEVIDNRISSVVADDGEYEVDGVVNAAGPWAARMNEMVGIDAPLQYYRSGHLITGPLDRESTPLIVDQGIGSSLRVDETGDFFISLDKPQLESPDEPDTVTLEEQAAALERVEKLIPMARDLDIIQEWKGVIVMTPDGHPILGPTPVDNYYLAIGFNGQGVMLAPRIGEVLAETIATEQENEVTQQLQLSRFESDDAIAPEGMSFTRKA